MLELAGALNEGVAAQGLTPAVPASGAAQSHIVTFGALDAGGHGFSSDPRIGPVSAHLLNAKVAHTIRRGQLRFAVHAYNNDDDINTAIECTAEALQQL